MEDEILTVFDFSTALLFLKGGTHVQRKGWNGKGLEIIYRKGYPDGIPCNESTARAYGLNVGDTFYCEPYFQIHNMNTHTVNTWVPSVSDILADDWVLVLK